MSRLSDRVVAVGIIACMQVEDVTLFSARSQPITNSV